MTGPLDDPRVRRLRRRLLRWGREELADTPWRRTRDPWLVLVSETMLQQTQVERVVPRYEAFVDRFPDAASCAAAARAEVLRLWAGLGYNRRAVSLHRTAAAVVRDHGGTVPSSLEDLLALPGVGPYTARAVRVFAHGLPDAVVDVNVRRVVSRAVAGERRTPPATQALADALVDGLSSGQAWTWNQSLMELGARHCRKRAPRCGSCPLQQDCAWTADGPDPAAGTSPPQSRFEGSDRQGRGRLVAAARAGAVAVADADRVTGWGDPVRTASVVAGLVSDGLLCQDGAVLRLPDEVGG